VPCDNGEKYFGLVNVANTCYVNSVVQALYFCAPFRKAMLRNLSEDSEDDPNSDSLMTSLAELFAQIDSQKRTVGCLTPRQFLAKLRKANDLFCNAEHQDAHEFLQFLLNDILESATKREKRKRERLAGKERDSRPPANGVVGALFPPIDDPGGEEKPEEDLRTWVHDIFQGYLVNQTRCLCCENVTARRETFLDLSVDIERHTSIAACLRTFESTELLQAGNKFFCDMCGCLQEAEKRLRIYQLPSVLTLHLKRFKYVERLGRCCRLPYRVIFPLQLRIVEHPRPRRNVPGAARGAGVANGYHSAANGAHGADGATDEGSSEQRQAPPSRLFELRSVVVHIGRDSSRGHYVTVVRSGDRCVLLDDDVVRPVEQEVLRSFYGTAGTGVGSSQYQGDNGGGQGAPEDGGTNLGGSRSSQSSERGNSGGRSYPSHSSSAPLYERSPEGTCCGYLLFYELVDGASKYDNDGSAIDVGAAVDWISEECNLTDSDSGESGDERNGTAQEKPRPQPPGEESELTQAFEQRCIPRRAAQRADGRPPHGVDRAAGVANGAAAGR